MNQKLHIHLCAAIDYQIYIFLHLKTYFEIHFVQPLSRHKDNNLIFYQLRRYNKGVQSHIWQTAKDPSNQLVEQIAVVFCVLFIVAVYFSFILRVLIDCS